MKVPAKNLLAQLVNGVREPVLVVSRVKSHARISFFNPAFQHLLGMPSGDILGMDVEKLMQRIGGSAAMHALESCNEATPQARFESVMMSADREDQPIDGEVVLASGGKDTKIVYLRPQPMTVDAAVSSESGVLRSLELTGSFVAPDAWIELLRRDVAIAAREHVWMALIVFRIDAYAAYIDTFGQHAGDSAIKRISHSIRRRLKRAGDSATRLGEDEIAVIVHGSSAPTVREFAHSIAADIRALAIHHPKSNVARHVTVSVGVCGEVPDARDDCADRMLAAAREKVRSVKFLEDISGAAGAITAH